MTVELSSFLDVAQTLLNTGKECRDRSSVSRSYYAAYHACLKWEAKLKAPGSSAGLVGGVHQQLINRLSNPAPELAMGEKNKSKLLASQLNIFKAHRHIADYSLCQDEDFANWARNDLVGIKSMVERMGFVVARTEGGEDGSQIPAPTSDDDQADQSFGGGARPSLKLIK